VLNRSSPVFVAGHQGLVGSAISRCLKSRGFEDLRFVERSELDLRDQLAVNNWFQKNRPRYVFLSAGTVGGILANSTQPAKFLYDNLMIHTTVVDASHRVGVEKLLYLGSSCIYPRETNQPITEDSLLTGPLEPTNEGYALAKIAGIKLCESYRRQYGDDFISAMPSNLYGPGDNFDLEEGHVLPALIRRFHESKNAGDENVVVWGTGSVSREFLHVDDLADACLFLMDHYSDFGHINVGTGVDCTIRELATMVRDLVHPSAELIFDTSKPDGMPRKVLNVEKIRDLGWLAKIDLADGLASTYQWFREALSRGEVRL
tara:strand:- start:576 stop:1526 length:951 start_codon:yes stop_codon:yes gene_type:complete